MNRMDNYIILKGKKIPMSDETANSLLEAQKEESIILVPDNIKFSKSGNSYSMGLGFGNNQELSWNYFDRTWMVVRFGSLTKTKLVSCEYEDLEVGDWYFCSTYECCTLSYGIKEQYRLVGKGEDWHIEDNKIVVDSFKDSWNYYWKVVEV